MKKIISLTPAFFGCIFLLVFSFFMSVVGLVFEVLGLVEEKGAGLLSFLVFGGLFFLCLWVLNRLGCVVWFEDGIIKRKGLIGGFYKQCPVESAFTQPYPY